MRLDINLATRPYEDAREFWARWGLGVALLALLTLFLLGLTASDWIKAGKDRREIAQLQQSIAKRDQERAQAQAFLDLAANRSTRDQSQFLNGLIQRKSFSWTRVFEDLEQVMPSNLHVLSLRPELNEQNQMELEMKVACDTRAAAVELVHLMESSKHFQGAQLVQENVSSDSGSGIAASVSAIYVPDTASDSTPDSAPNPSADSGRNSGRKSVPNSKDRSTK
jgi:type IV pilus assembly protein PilN